MNRAERRKLQKKLKGQNVMMNPGSEKIDRTNHAWCWRHTLKFENKDNPTERDKKLIKSVRLVPFKSTDENGHTVLGRMCHRCGNTILLEKPLHSASKESILETPQGDEYGNLSVPDMPE